MTIEQLREDMVFLVQGCSREFYERYASKLNDLISAARAEGVADERERILVSAVYMKQIGSIMKDCYIVPSSVLAPKEIT
jgi:hypothetical protein